jgi:formate/nitrite transporter FocA (FNT family)
MAKLHVLVQAVMLFVGQSTAHGMHNYTTISAYHHKSREFEPRSWRDVLDTTLCD